MHAFVDCPSFELTVNRGSIRNTDLEIIEKVKNKVNEILSDKKIKSLLSEREEWEDLEKRLREIELDEKELKDRFKSAESKKQIILTNGAVIFEPTKTKSGYSESETLILLISLLTYYPDLLPFKILDYNTLRGIDFVIEKSGYPRYIELKGTMRKKVNHSFRHIYKFICYDVDTSLKTGDIISDASENLEVRLEINKDAPFESFDDNFMSKKYTSYQLMPKNPNIQSMEIVVLKKLLIEVIGAKFG